MACEHDQPDYSEIVSSPVYRHLLINKGLVNQTQDQSTCLCINPEASEGTLLNGYRCTKLDMASAANRLFGGDDVCSWEPIRIHTSDATTTTATPIPKTETNKPNTFMTYEGPLLTVGGIIVIGYIFRRQLGFGK